MMPGNLNPTGIGEGTLGQQRESGSLPAKMEAKVDTLCFLLQPKEGQQQI